MQNSIYLIKGTLFVPIKQGVDKEKYTGSARNIVFLTKMFTPKLKI